MRNCGYKKRLKFIFNNTLIAIFGAIIFLTFIATLCACGNKLPTDIDEDETEFDSFAYYETNTVEIISVGSFGKLVYGTGLIISGDDGLLILSNYHVTGRYGGLISIRFSGETEFINSNTIEEDSLIEVLIYDEFSDLAILKVDYLPIKMYNKLTQAIAETEIIPFSNHVNLADNQKIYSLGNAYGEGIVKLYGEIVSVEQSVNTGVGLLPAIKTTLAITEGCSGGPMFDCSGMFLGVTSFGGGSYGEEYSFSLPAPLAFRLYELATVNGLKGQVDLKSQ